MAHSEYLQHLAESGIPATVLLLSVLACLLYLAWQRAKTVLPENRIFHDMNFRPGCIQALTKLCEMTHFQASVVHYNKEWRTIQADQVFFGQVLLLGTHGAIN